MSAGAVAIEMSTDQSSQAGHGPSPLAHGTLSHNATTGIHGGAQTIGPSGQPPANHTGGRPAALSHPWGDETESDDDRPISYGTGHTRGQRAASVEHEGDRAGMPARPAHHVHPPPNAPNITGRNISTETDDDEGESSSTTGSESTQGYDAMQLNEKSCHIFLPPPTFSSKHDVKNSGLLKQSHSMNITAYHATVMLPAIQLSGGSSSRVPNFVARSLKIGTGAEARPIWKVFADEIRPAVAKSIQTGNFTAADLLYTLNESKYQEVMKTMEEPPTLMRAEWSRTMDGIHQREEAERRAIDDDREEKYATINDEMERESLANVQLVLKLQEDTLQARDEVDKSNSRMQEAQEQLKKLERDTPSLEKLRLGIKQMEHDLTTAINDAPSDGPNEAAERIEGELTSMKATARELDEAHQALEAATTDLRRLREYEEKTATSLNVASKIMEDIAKRKDDLLATVDAQIEGRRYKVTSKYMKERKDAVKAHDTEFSRYKLTPEWTTTMNTQIDRELTKTLKKVVTVVTKYGSRKVGDHRDMSKMKSACSCLTSAFAECAQTHNDWIMEYIRHHCTPEYSKVDVSPVSKFALSVVNETMLKKVAVSQATDKTAAIIRRMPGATVFEAAIGFYSTSQLYISRMEKHFSATTPRDVFAEIQKLTQLKHEYGRHPSETFRKGTELWEAAKAGAEASVPPVVLQELEFHEAMLRAFEPERADTVHTDVDRRYEAQRLEMITEEHRNSVRTDYVEKQIKHPLTYIEDLHSALQTEYATNRNLKIIGMASLKKGESEEGGYRRHQKGRRAPFGVSKSADKNGRFKPRRYEQANAASEKSGAPKCSKCFSDTHTMSQCPNEWAKARGRCFACGSRDHYFRNCTHPNKNELADSRRKATAAMNADEGKGAAMAAANEEDESGDRAEAFRTKTLPHLTFDEACAISEDIHDALQRHPASDDATSTNSDDDATMVTCS